jgi:hypothetical protein
MSALLLQTKHVTLANKTYVRVGYLYVPKIMPSEGIDDFMRVNGNLLP